MKQEYDIWDYGFREGRREIQDEILDSIRYLNKDDVIYRAMANIATKDYAMPTDKDYPEELERQEKTNQRRKDLGITPNIYKKKFKDVEDE